MEIPNIKDLIRQRSQTLDSSRTENRTGIRHIVGSSLSKIQGEFTVTAQPEDRWLVVLADRGKVVVRLPKGPGTIEVKRLYKSQYEIEIMADQEIEGHDMLILDADSSYAKLRWFDGHWHVVG